ncbi:MAG: cytochrome c [Flammeovirgaceae bacterium]|nr:cytochrome c [Flammeovirgaceae bacterium]
MKKLNFLILAVSSIILLSFQQKQGDLKASMQRGKEIYQSNCISCHMNEGEGLTGIFPPLSKSDYMLTDKKRAIKQTLYGVSGEMTVNEVQYNGEMNGYDLTDDYIFNSFDNKGGVTTPADVKSARKK